MELRGLKQHTHAERAAVIEQLIPLWQQKFGDNLLAVAATASYARGDDRAYSDLELLVLLRAKPEPEEDQYLQRVVDGMLIEALYTTEEEYLLSRSKVSGDWFLAASDKLLPVYNASFIERLREQSANIRPPAEQFVLQAARRFLEVQESFGKVLNAIAQRNGEAIGLLLFDATLHSLVTLSFLNQRPFTTFASFIAEARAFAIKPERFDELLDVVCAGSYQDSTRLEDLLVAVFRGFESIFAEKGFQLYDESLDPRLPNKRYV